MMLRIASLSIAPLEWPALSVPWEKGEANGK
jgi:hypothetical protein